MKILVIGFLALFCWSALSTYIYVCKVKGLCNETETTETVVNQRDVIAVDTLSKPIVREQAVIPKNLLIYFAFDKSEFNFDAVTDKYVNESNEYLDQNSQARLSITGHTDAIIIESKGEKEPADDNNTTPGRANNRRTEITIKH
jgi:outer membrane protein OmpA-like peptidoglycan-associated protein